MPSIELDKTTTALLIADFYVEMMGSLSHAVDRKVVDKTRALQRAARDAGILVCYSATVFRPGYLEISDRNKTFSQRKNSGQEAVSDPVQLIHPSVKPLPGEVVVGKHRVNALYGTGLDVALRANDIHDLVIFGYATSGVILSTVRYGADLDRFEENIVSRVAHLLLHVITQSVFGMTGRRRRASISSRAGWMRGTIVPTA